MRSLERGAAVGFRAAWAAVLRRVWRLLGAQLLVDVLVVLLLLTVVGIPCALKKFVDWQFVQKEIFFEDRGIRAALRGSTRVVHGHWWRTAVVAGLLWLISQLPGPLLGFALLFTAVPLYEVNLLGSVVFALLVPFVVIARTLLYLDLCARGVRARTLG